MKKIFFNVLSKVFLIIGIVLAFSCDDVASPTEEDYAETSIGPRIKEFTSTASATTAAVGNEIIFTDYSLGVESRTWTFPGGSPTVSSEPVVNVIFSETGLKACTLEILFFDGSVEVQTYNIQVVGALTPSFTSTPIVSGSSVTFTDTSVGSPDGWYWEFPGGSPATSTEQNPTVTWPSDRDVTITLIVSRSSDGAEAIYQLPTSVGPPNLWKPAAQGFEDPSAVSFWQTWNGSAGWPAGSLTTVSGGANGTPTAGSVAYNGEAYWSMITRDSRPYNAVVYKGKSYRISFWIKSSTPTTVPHVRFVNEIPAWWSDARKNGDPTQAWAGGQGVYSINVTTDWQYHEAEFTLTDLPYDVGFNAFVDIELQGGVSPNTIFIDEIRLQQLD